MNDAREILRRAVGDYTPDLDAYERVLRRGERKRRNHRILAGAVAAAIVLLGTLAFLRAISVEPRPMNGVELPLPPGTRPVFQRTTTIGGLTLTSPSDWYLVDYWGDWNPDGTSLDRNAIPLLELTNFDPGLSTPVCDAAPGQPTRLPADGVAIIVTVGNDGRNVADLCGGSIETSSSGTVGPTPYHGVMTVGPAVTEGDRAAAEEIWNSMTWAVNLTFYTRGRSPRYVLDGWQDGTANSLLEALPSKRNVELSSIEVDGSGVGESTVANVDVPRPNAVQGDTFGAVTEDAARVEMRLASGGEPLVARLIDLPDTLDFPFDAYVFESQPKPTATREVVAMGTDGVVLGSNLPPLFGSMRVGTVHAFGTTWSVKASRDAEGFWTTACVEPAAIGSASEPCVRGPGAGADVQTAGEPNLSVFVSQVVGSTVASVDVRSDDGTVFHAVMVPIRDRGSDAGTVAVVALEGGGRGKFIYQMTDGKIYESGTLEWQDLGQVIGAGSFLPPDRASP
jgi:hypothetical protein